MKKFLSLGTSTPHKDFRGRPISIGDLVIYNATNRGTWLREAIVVGFTPQMIKLIQPDSFEKLKPREDTMATSYTHNNQTHHHTRKVSFNNAPANVALANDDVIKPEVLGWFK